MDLKAGRMILYRGSLKSCNYRCGYCPFSKHPQSERELLKDKEQWLRFCGSLRDRAPGLDVRAVMVTPYGEALIHPWYWEGLGRLGAMEVMEGVGAQTNLSFPLEESLDIYQSGGGKMEKLRLWATFHPQMIGEEEFAQTCQRLWGMGVCLCVGAVGVVENLDRIKRLRRMLPQEIYLWINRMDGLKRKYTKEEQEAFEGIDPYFGRELETVPADPARCQGRLFVEGSGKVRRCNISRALEGNWYDLKEEEWETVPCGTKICSCYLAYGGRDEVMNRVLFGPFPLFRIPAKPKAVFLDIDGTLIPKGGRGIPGRTVDCIQALAKDGCRLFFATSLPYGVAKKSCGEVWQLFDGGIFAGGAHVAFEKDGERREFFSPLEQEWLSALKQQGESFHFRAVAYRYGDGSSGDGSRGGIYKITLVRPKHMGWTGREAGELGRQWGARAERTKGDGEESAGAETGFLGGEWVMENGKGRVRWFAEDNCLQIVHEKATKAEGVRRICQVLGITPKEAAAAGDSLEDREMMELCSFSGRI